MPLNRAALHGVVLALIAFVAAPSPASSAEAVAPAALADLLAAAPGRSEEDKARDAQRRPADVLAFLGLEPGMSAMDVWAAGGWYTEVLSIAVGPEGKVLAQNPPAVLKFRDGANDKALTARLAGGRLANVTRLDAPTDTLGLAPASLDFAMTALNFHDVYNGQGEEAAKAFASSVYAVLKPGGIFGVVDHVGLPDGDNKRLHRIDPAIAKSAIESAGFHLEETSDVLAHPEDDHTLNVFDPKVRGNTDRFVLRFRKPGA